MSAATTDYDVVIVGAGASGSILAKQLGLAGKKVLILEAGAGTPPNINAFMQRFYTSVAKTPESPYTPNLFTPPVQAPPPSQVGPGEHGRHVTNGS